MHLVALYIYPVKSLRGCAVAAAEVDDLGVVGDRRFLIVESATGKFITQRTLPRMALITTGLGPATLLLSAEGRKSISVPRAPDPAAALRSVSIWKSEGLLAEDCGDAAAAWLSDFLGLSCRLVRAGEKFLRPNLKPAAGPGDRVNFADSCPFMMIGEATLADLNDRLATQGEAALPINRFRPNLVVTGAGPFAEDSWPRVRIGDITLRSAGPCTRCAITTTDQFTAERGREPLRTLASYRRAASDPTDINFGQNFIHETKQGILRVGDPVELLG